MCTIVVREGCALLSMAVLYNPLENLTGLALQDFKMHPLHL